ncbi:histone-lysine N-methyltransferase NSD2 [Aplysia californica]|uniref:Histone-lysine N-methyltransferase NSD2 n=1 Tax=Aplysia californica TaxID=6500 RepID=A0ABM0JVD2_APLCA|nr:histone-lysine N-methyltransferase NSD2 [Aplysia californica]XP_005102413.1 histone-lysine N-methyltransferase NSD2 [Aplysia californica]
MNPFGNSMSSPALAGCHRLPQIATMGRNIRTAQSKASAKQNLESKPGDESAVLHVEGTSKVIKILTDGIAEFTEDLVSRDNVQSEDPAPLENSVAVADDEGEKKPRKTKRQRKSDLSKVNAPASGDSSVSLSEAGSVSANELIPKSTVDTVLPEMNENVGPTLHGVEANTEMNEAPQKVECPVLDLQTAISGQRNNERNRTPRGRGRKRVQKNEESAVNPEVFKAEKIESSEVNQLQNISKAIEEAATLENEDKKVHVAPAGHIPRCVLILPSEVPAEAQLEKLMSMASSIEYDHMYPPLYEEGELLWAKVSGHPYWPCMVARCPFSKMYTRIKGDIRVVRSYHVQFFGNEVERGWVNEASMLKFEGKLKFLERAQVETATKQPKRGKSNYNPFKINITRRHAWNIAVDEAESAIPLSEEDRIVQYSFDYVFVEDEKKMKLKAKEESEGEDAGTLKAKRGRKRKRQTSGSEDTSPEAKRKRGKKSVGEASPFLVTTETSFDAYYASHRSTVIDQHPEWDTSLVFEYLRQQWEIVSDKKKNLQKKSRALKSPLVGNKHGTTTEMSSQGKQLMSSPLQPDSSKRGRKSSKLLKLLTSDSVPSSAKKSKEFESDEAINKIDSIIAAVAANSEAETPEQSVVQPRKRGRVKKVPDSNTSVSELSRSSTPASFAEEGVEEDLLRPKVAASALSARKASHESDSSTEGKTKGLKENEQYELEIFKLLATSRIEKDSICAVCEKNENVVECSGSCCQHFHLACVGMDLQSDASFKCPECTSGIHSCFLCKKADIDTKRCCVALCGKYYHEGCVKKLRLTRQESKGFVCPLHTCATCAVDNLRNPRACKGRLFKCVRCPTAYHVGDFCVAAGSVNLVGTNILCSSHFQPNKSLTLHARLNITWCFSCSKGGTLLCCEGCPAAFHAECVKVEKTPEEAWYCIDCAAGRKPLYGNIVWIKVGNYRWWPGEICHPRNVPRNIQERPHQVGEFPVRFFGSHDYYWIHRGRVFNFQEGDKGSKESSSRGLFKVYMRGVKEATEAFKLWTAAKAKKVEQEQERSDKKPGPYKIVKSNVPIGNVQIYKAELSEIPRCECKPDQEDACSSDCLNRMMMYECHPSVCPAGDKCCNQRFQKRQYPDCEPFKCEGRGWGLRSSTDLKKGQFVCEYVGDLIDEEECKKRIEHAHEDNITNFYMLTMDKNRIIDAGPKGNFSRFMNHSCCPNLETQKWMVNGDIRVGLFTLREIPKGEELTFNYNLECLGNEKKACACGAENCSGFLGVRPKTAAAAANEKRAKEAKKRKRKKKLDPRKEHEDDCFRCGEGGELVMCDKGNCPKVYHLQCLKLTKPPSGKWLCPWHHCDDCGKLSTSRCSECPNSYCAVHTQGNIFMIEGTAICSDHTDLLEGVTQSLNECSMNGIPSGDSAVDSESDISVKADNGKMSSNTSETGLPNVSDNGIISSNSEPPLAQTDCPKMDEGTPVTVDGGVTRSQPSSSEPVCHENVSLSDINELVDSKKNLLSSDLSGHKAFTSTDSSVSPDHVKSVSRGRGRLSKSKRAQVLIQENNKDRGKQGAKNTVGSGAFDESDNDSISDLVIDIPTA